MTSPSSSSSWLLLLLSCLALALLAADAEVHHHEFVVQETPVKRLCKTHNVITVNGQYPGPTLEVREGDTLVINVVNRAQYNVTIHWHGIRQMRTGWADGPEFVTQCLQRHRRRRRLRRGDQEPRQGQGPRERRRAPLLHRRPRPVQLRAGPALRRAQQQHPLHGQHEQRLLRLPADRLPPPRALLQDPRRLHHRLPGAPAGAVRLHGAERQPGPVAAGPRDQAVPAQVRLRGAARPAGHQHRHAREPPHPHPWLRFLHPR
ncbi:Laccase-13 [Zea mays]|uniref:Laccase-13 n=1 Tax=Zea mays TaxID=4577 RepID=A0A1D6G902_MAIZE|nr:Laccase-13 [Zea mays]